MRGRGRLLVLAIAAALTTAACSLPRWPVNEDAALTSPFGLRWYGTLPSLHHGVDIRASEGTPIRAMTGGTVNYAGWMRGFGNVVRIDHRENLMTLYAHLSEIHVSEGEEVGGRDVVGLAGSTGTATGAHLHFEVWMNGRPVDPVTFLGRRP